MMIVGFLLFVYIWITVGDLIIKRQRVGIPFTNLTLSHLFACFNPELRFPSAYVMVFFNKMK